MNPQAIQFACRLPVSAGEAFRWHTRPGAFERLIPPWETVQVQEQPARLGLGSRYILLTQAGPFCVRWVAEITAFQEGRLFQDLQREGPFSHWEHTHRFVPDGESACRLEDEIQYRLRGGPAGQWLMQSYVRNKLQRMFGYRHQVLAHDLSLASRSAGTPPLRILVSGAKGLIGSALTPFLQALGHEVIPLRRGRSGLALSGPHWDPEAGRIDLQPAGRIDAAVHLAGETITGRWTAAKKASILQSRAQGTRLLAAALAQQAQPPATLVVASALGYYGDRGDEVITEQSRPGAGFLAEVARAWEDASAPAVQAGIRVVNARLGLVLSPKGGALTKLLLPFRVGLGGRVGHGRQYWSWVAMDDALGLIYHALITPSLAGPVNAVAPNPVTNIEFAAVLARVLRRPAVLPLPAFAVRALLGEMGEHLLLASTRAQPVRLLESGFEFEHPTLEGALRHVLGVPPRTW